MTPPSRAAIEFDGYRIPDGIDLLYRGPEVVPLPPRAVEVLRYLATNADRVVPKAELLEEVWSDVFTTDGVLKKAVAQIRRALGDNASRPRFVRTHHKRGYRFLASPLRGSSTASARTSAASRDRVQEMVPHFDHFIGREPQLATLRGELASTIRASSGRTVIVRGEPGIGKSALGRELTDWARDRGVRYCHGRFFREGNAPPRRCHMLFELLAETLGGSGLEELPALAADQLQTELHCWLTGDGETAGDLPVQLAHCWSSVARAQPLLMVLDDLQWADETSLEALGRLMRIIDSRPLMLVLLVRPDDGPVGEWLAEHGMQRSYTALTLRGLDRNACRTLIGEVFLARRSGEIPSRDVDRLHDLSGGNPHVLLETLRSLVADGAVVPDTRRRRWIWKRTRDLPLPGSVLAASRTRIARLSAETLRVVEIASVIGTEFRIAVIAGVLQSPESEIEKQLQEATESGVLSLHRVSSEEDFRFSNASLRRVVYEAIPRSRRRRLHSAVAKAISSLHAQRLDTVVSRLSEHYAEAGDSRAAYEFSLRAWEIARSRCTWLDALTLVERAEVAATDLEHAAALAPNERLALDLATGETLLSLGRSVEALTAFQRAESRMHLIEDCSQRVRLMLLLGRTHVARGQYRVAAGLLHQSLDSHLENGDTEQLCRIRLELAGVESALGRYDAVDELVGQVLASNPPEEMRALANGIRGQAMARRGDFSAARRLLREAISSYERSDDLRERAAHLRHLHSIQLCLGEYESAIESAVRARSDSIATGDLRGEAQANLGIGEARVSQGLLESGVSFLKRSLQRLESAGDLHCQARALWALARARIEYGDFEEASSLIFQALELVASVGDRGDELRILLDRSRIELARRELGAARETAEAALAMAVELGHREGAALATLQLGWIDLEAGDLKAAADRGRRARDVLDRIGSIESWRAWALICIAGRLAGDRDSSKHALDRSVALINELGKGITRSDQPHWGAIGENHAGPARELCALLASEGLTREATLLGQKWSGRP